MSDTHYVYWIIYAFKRALTSSGVYTKTKEGLVKRGKRSWLCLAQLLTHRERVLLRTQTCSLIGCLGLFLVSFSIPTVTYFPLHFFAFSSRVLWLLDLVVLSESENDPRFDPQGAGAEQTRQASRFQHLAGS